VKICVIANRYRVDQFRWLVSGLIALGHDVFYWVDSAESLPGAAATKRSILDHRFDLGISADWCFFGDPATPLNRLLPGHPPFLNLCFNSPFDALLELSGHADLPRFLRENRIRLGLLSPADRPALAAFGIDDAVDLPCGIGTRTLSYGEDLRLFPIGYMPAADHVGHLADYTAVLARQERFFAADGQVCAPADLLFLGTADLLVEDHFPTFCFGNLAPDLPHGLAWYARTFATTIGFAADRGRAERDAAIAAFLDGFPECRRPEPAAWLWRRRLAAILERGHRLAGRRAYCAALKERYGARFQLFGNDWAPFGIAALPQETKLVHLRYRAAALSLDFGSLSYDTLLFPRSADIVQDGGLLVQSRLADSAEVLGDLGPAMTFEDAAGLMALTDGLLADPARRAALRTAVRDRLRHRYDLEAVLARAVDAVSGA
jgi:hypothetical protein